MEQSELIINGLKKLGFSEYESKAYLKLLESYPVNGYALSKSSGIPRSRIYEVLKSLMEKQMVFEQIKEKSTLYTPVEPDVFLKRVRLEFEDIFSGVADYTNEVYDKHGNNEHLVVVNGRRNIVDFITLLIKSASKRIALSIWEEELQELLPELSKAASRGVALRGIYLGENNPFSTLVPHRRLKRYMEQKKQRHIYVIIDGETVLSGIVSKGEASKATWTRDEGFVEIAEDYIAHDLVVNLFSGSLSDSEYRKFEAFSEDVHRDYYRFSDKETLKYKELL